MRTMLRGFGMILASGLLALGPAWSARAADEKPVALDRKVENERIYKSLHDIIDQGADLYNNGDRAACYHLYQGALLALKPLVDHRPDWQKAIETGVADSGRLASVAERAFALRAVMDRIRSDIHPPKPGTVKIAGKSLWDRLGGETNVRKVVDDFVTAAAADKAVDFDRNHKFTLDANGLKRFKQLLVEFVSSATGGPLKYTGRNMKVAHEGMAITDAQFTALAVDLKAALEKNGAKPDDVKAVLKAVEGTRKDIVEAKKTTANTLWDRLGGEKSVRKVVDDFVEAAAADDKVDFDRDGHYLRDPKELPKLKQSMVAFLSSVTGGPLEYKGKSMKEAHKDMKITAGQFDALAADLKKVLKANGAKEEDVKAVLDLVETTRKDIVTAKPEEKKPEDKKPEDMGSVSGKILLNGKPVVAGKVTFVSEKKATYAGNIKEDGTYMLEDLLPGSYKVTVTSDKPAVPKKYTDEKTTDLQVEVKKGENTIDLELSE